MRDSVLLLSASPHKNGTTSRISALIEDGCRRAGFRTAVLDFSGMNFLGCTHCGTCSQRLRHCPLEGKDDCSETFATIIGSRYLVIVSPIYNYGLPAQFKALVDRTQYFYSSGIKPRIAPPRRRAPSGGPDKGGKALRRGAAHAALLLPHHGNRTGRPEDPERTGITPGSER